MGADPLLRQLTLGASAVTEAVTLGEGPVQKDEAEIVLTRGLRPWARSARRPVTPVTSAGGTLTDVPKAAILCPP
ncbi:hypothetical protein SRO_0341 [Streptomyces rochei]|nr:hypothetical protein SRO_0341 [Streptomyces rochei]